MQRRTLLLWLAALGCVAATTYAQRPAGGSGGHPGGAMGPAGRFGNAGGLGTGNQPSMQRGPIGQMPGRDMYAGTQTMSQRYARRGAGMQGQMGQPFNSGRGAGMRGTGMQGMGMRGSTGGRLPGPMSVGMSGTGAMPVANGFGGHGQMRGQMGQPPTAGGMAGGAYPSGGRRPPNQMRGDAMAPGNMPAVNGFAGPSQTRPQMGPPPMRGDTASGMNAPMPRDGMRPGGRPDTGRGTATSNLMRPPSHEFAPHGGLSGETAFGDHLADDPGRLRSTDTWRHSATGLRGGNRPLLPEAPIDDTAESGRRDRPVDLNVNSDGLGMERAMRYLERAEAAERDGLPQLAAKYYEHLIDTLPESHAINKVSQERLERLRTGEN